MALKVDATFENGVFVPADRPDLANHEQVSPDDRNDRAFAARRPRRCWLRGRLANSP